MKQVILTGILFFLMPGIFAQPLEDLRTRKQKAREELEYTSRLLEKSKKNEKVSVNRLRLINNQIKQRNTIIGSLNSEIEFIGGLINDNTIVVAMLQEDLEGIRGEYAKMVRFSYKSKGSSNYLMFLLSSNDFNQAYKRYLYLKQYSGYRKMQAKTIGSLQEILAKKVNDLNLQKEEKNKLLNSHQKESRQLGNEKSQQNGYISKMRKEQRLLRRKIKQQQKIEQELEKQILEIIEEEARKAREAGRPGYSPTPEQELIGKNFGQNKSRLPWPVERGIITEKFGTHKHPTLKYVTINNNGVDITTEPGSKARAVYNGEVSRVFAISGGNMAVIIRHGRYLSVYSNLAEVNVKAGDKVGTKQTIGTIYTDLNEGDKTILKFQVWFENKKLNPEDWIVKQFF